MGARPLLCSHSHHVFDDVFRRLHEIWIQSNTKWNSYFAIYCDYNRYVIRLIDFWLDFWLEFWLIFNLIIQRTRKYVSFDKICGIDSCTPGHQSTSRTGLESGGMVYNQKSDDRNNSLDVWFLHICSYNSGFVWIFALNYEFIEKYFIFVSKSKFFYHLFYRSYVCSQRLVCSQISSFKWRFSRPSYQ